ncbi:EF-hand domain-containing protein [Sphingomonas sp. LT1P40]|uniref:EF-hand domain-containing protein n=1 Tax=Alteristakelama amylovorans TaxID=3096166 RepID=UPI002FC8AB4E
MKNLLTATAIGAMLTAGVAIAMQTAPATPAKQPVSKATMLARADARFDAMDTNKDGQLSVDERKAGMEKARAAMAERKGGEMSDFMPGRRGGGGMGERMMGRADTNGDGMISKAENRATVEARFARMDADKDGSIEAGEGRKAIGKKSWGKRGEGREGKRGMRAGRGPGGGGMMMADADKDGVITRAEFDAQSAQRFAKLDANADGRLTAEELRAGRPQRGPTPSPAPAPQGE